MQRKLVPAVLFVLSASALAQSDAKPSLTGHWTASIDYYGTHTNFGVDLTQQGNKLTGKFGGDSLEGETDGSSFHFTTKDNEGGTAQAKGTIVDNTLQGEVIEIESSTPTHVTYTFTATQRPPRPSAAPQSHDFIPTVFYRQFSPFNKPVLTVNPGDTIHTTTVDAGGNDHDSQKRVMGGNPQTGPFFIQSAMPGDILVVHINRLRLNRDWAMSDDDLVSRATDSDLAVKMKDAGKTIVWHLDLANGTASPVKPTERLAHYTVPIKPMLGCIATATGTASAPPGTGDSGNYGGNMDFNEITDGATVYLPVSNPGALLYLGDGHALQGDGELNGNALETSMDVEFTVDVIPNKHLPSPRVENPTSIIALGYDGSLDSAFRDATSNMAQWLTDDYNLTPTEVAQVLGTAAQYKVAEVADRNTGIALKVDKALLHPLPRVSK
ncbi:MAG TPA: acetamidase/formamidase family protein [Edaphobacter sp.]|nr:acetamidase/formamidase family protein [Edaphobacter sp.]